MKILRLLIGTMILCSIALFDGSLYGKHGSHSGGSHHSSGGSHRGGRSWGGRDYFYRNGSWGYYDPYNAWIIDDSYPYYDDYPDYYVDYPYYRYLGGYRRPRVGVGFGFGGRRGGVGFGIGF
jgi:hypothetical protein